MQSAALIPPCNTNIANFDEKVCEKPEWSHDRYTSSNGGDGFLMFGNQSIGNSKQ